MTHTDVCQDCRLFLIQFPKCLSLGARLEHGEVNDRVSRCKNKAKKKHGKCGICRQYNLKTDLKPIGKDEWYLKQGKEIEIDPNLPVCPKCRQRMNEKSEEVKKVAKKIGVSASYLKYQPHWIQEGRGPTVEEFTAWARNQHKRACKRYQAAYPVSGNRGKCHHFITMKKPCVSFFSHTGICETGFFEPERMHHLLWTEFNKQARKAARVVKKELI